MMAEVSRRYVYEEALEAVELGQMFAVVPVIYEGEPATYTTFLSLPLPETDTDAFVQALALAKRARREAEQLGAHPC